MRSTACTPMKSRPLRTCSGGNVTTCKKQTKQIIQFVYKKLLICFPTKKITGVNVTTYAKRRNILQMQQKVQNKTKSARSPDHLQRSLVWHLRRRIHTHIHTYTQTLVRQKKRCAHPHPHPNPDTNIRTHSHTHTHTQHTHKHNVHYIHMYVPPHISIEATWRGSYLYAYIYV